MSPPPRWKQTDGTVANAAALCSALASAWRMWGGTWVSNSLIADTLGANGDTRRLVERAGRVADLRRGVAVGKVADRWALAQSLLLTREVRA